MQQKSLLEILAKECPLCGPVMTALLSEEPVDMGWDDSF